MAMRTVHVGLTLTLALILVACGGGSTGLAGSGTIGVASITGPLPSSGAAFTITGGDYSNEVGTPALIRFEADGGATPFSGGSSAVAEVWGTITSATTIEGVSPPAVICGVASVEAYVTVFLQSGVWGRSATPIAILVAPTLSGISGAGLFQAAVPGPYTLTGTGFSPVGGLAIVQWTAPASLFQDGASTQIKTHAIITSDTTITGVSPLALVCGTPLEAAAIDNVAFPDGSCTPPGTSIAVSFEAPTVASVTNEQIGGPWMGTINFAAAVPETFELVGTGFGPVGGIAHVQWSTAGLPSFQGGTADTVQVPGIIVSDTMIRGISPEAVLIGVASRPGRLEVTLPQGACSMPPPADLFALLPPTILGIANIDRGGSSFFSTIPEAFEVTGTDFGPVGGLATIGFLSQSAAPADMPFLGGTSTGTGVVCIILSRTLIQGTSPEGVLVPVRDAGAGTNLVSLNADLNVDVLLGQGSSSPAPLSGVSQLLGPTTTTVDGGPAPTDVPSTMVLGAIEADGFTLAGTGFAPVGQIATVTFEDIAGTGFDGSSTATAQGTIVSETLIQGTLPTITSPRLAADLSARVVATMPNGSEAYSNSAVNFVAPPTITTVTSARAPFQQASPALATPNTWLTLVPADTTITGTGFDLAVTDLWYDTVLGATTPIGAGLLGTLPEPTATAPGVGTARTVTAPTTINGASPVDATLTEATQATLRLLNPDGQFHEFAGLTFETTGVLPNINAAPLGGNQAEMQISVNPMNPLNAAICAHHSSGGFVQMTHAYTLDGGNTWAQFFVGPSTSPAPDAFPDGSFRFDPMGIFDRFGNYYCIYGVDPGGIGAPTGLRSIVVQRSSDGGATFDTVTVPPFPLDNLDRWTVASGPVPVDTASEQVLIGLENLTTQDQLLGGVMTSALGASVSTLGSIIINDLPVPPGRGYAHCAPAIGPNGENYVSYIEHDGFFPPVPQTLIFVEKNVLASATDVLMASTDNSGFRLQDGTFTPEVNRGKGVIPMGQVIMTGPNAGRAVWVWSDMDPNGVNGRDTTVVTQYSDDGALTWSSPQPVHGLQPDFQFFPWMGRDPVRGDLYVGYYDTRRDPTRQAVEWYITASVDGATWTSSFLVAQAPSNAGAFGANDMLEYNGVSVVDGWVYTCWADNSNFTGDNPSGTLAPDGFDVLTSVLQLDPDDN